MIRPKLSLRRPLAVLGATFLGLTAAVAVSAPASAHHPVISGKAVCINKAGDWKVEWTVGNSERDLPATLTKVKLTPRGTTAAPIAEGAELPANRGSITGEQLLTSRNGSATLEVTAQWTRDGHRSVEVRTKSAEKKINKPSSKTCPKTDPTTPPPVEPSQTPEPTEPPVEPSQTPEPTQPPVEPSQTPEPTQPPADVTEPEGYIESTCDEMIFGIINPENGESITITLTPNKGEPQTLTVEPGKEGSVSFPAEDGLEVTATGDDLETETIAWEKPEGCESGGGGGLPVTGAAAGGIAGGAALLLAVGGGLFYLARRRRVTFTA